MRTANPFDGRAFVRSRNDVNPKRRGGGEGGGGGGGSETAEGFLQIANH